MQSPYASKALKGLYDLLRKARQLGWRTRLTKKGRIRLYPPNSGTCHCPITAAYKLKSGRYAPSRNAAYEASRNLGLDLPISSNHPGSDCVSVVVMKAADMRVRNIRRENLSQVADPSVRVRSNMFRILGLGQAHL